MTAQALAFRIIIEKPIAGILYGLQKGSGNSYETIQKQLSNSGDLVFDIMLPLKTNKEGTLVLHGPFVQGPPNEKFLYIDIGSYAGQHHPFFNGRLKIPLTGITGSTMREAVNGKLLLAKIPGTKGKNGQPNMGTVKPFEGWKIGG